jgi:hypothetical protein
MHRLFMHLQFVEKLFYSVGLFHAQNFSSDSKFHRLFDTLVSLHVRLSNGSLKVFLFDIYVKFATSILNVYRKNIVL